MRVPFSPIRLILLFIFFLSGMFSLVYEVVWTRLYALTFGNTTLAVATVLSAFMLGLGLGAYAAGKMTRRLQKPLKIYGLIEIGIGLCALLVPLSQPLFEIIFSAAYHQFSDSIVILYLMKFVAVFLIMLPSTLLMGSTLPVFLMAWNGTDNDFGDDLARIYGINTFGAVSGTLLAGFFMIRLIGVHESIYLAIAGNIMIGLVSMVISAGNRHAAMQPEEEATGANDIQRMRTILIIMAVSGFCALAYEVIWNRLLVFIMTNSVYAFAIMLSTFLIGISIGSVLGGKLTSSQRLFEIFGWNQILLGVSALLASAGLMVLPVIHNMLFSVTPTTSWWEWNFIRLMESFMVMILPTLLMGASFPIAGRLLVRDFSQRGQRIGNLYLINTMGGMAGSAVAGFILVPLLGTARSIVLLVLINIALGLYVVMGAASSEKSGRKRVIAFLSIALPGLITMLLLPASVFGLLFSNTEQGFVLTDFREGIEGTVTVHEREEVTGVIKRIDVDGLNVAGTSFMLRTLQTLQGHLPLFIHPEAREVVQIGFGTGQTSHCALRHDLQSFRVIEISRDVLNLSAVYFNQVNQHVFDNPGFQVTISDGKNFIKNTPLSFDIIMNDANYAVATGSASLFTKDHFENCRKKLNTGGVLSTWMTTDLDPEDFKIVLKTFHSVFPYCLLWMAPNCINKQVVLMGSEQPIRFDLSSWNRLLSLPGIREDLSRINIGSVYDLLCCLILDETGIEALTEDVPVNTDNRPVLEFSTRAIRARDFCAFQNLAAILTQLPELKKYIYVNPDSASGMESRLHKYALARNELLVGILRFYQGRMQESLKILLDGSRLIPESSLGAYFFEMMDGITANLLAGLRQNPDDPDARLEFISYQLGMGQYKNACQHIRTGLQKHPEHPGLLYERARYFVETGNADSALAGFEQTVRRKPDFAAAYYYIGTLLLKKGAYDDAGQNLVKALQLDPRLYEAENELGYISQKLERYDAAIDHYRLSLMSNPYQPEVLSRMGDCYLGLNSLKTAAEYYRKAIHQSWADAHTLKNLANVYFLSGDFKTAIAYYQEALERDPSDSQIYYNLGNARAGLRQFREAIDAFKKAIGLNDQEADYYNNLAMSYRATGDLKNAMHVFSEGLKRHAQSELLQKNVRETRGLLRSN